MAGRKPKPTAVKKLEELVRNGVRARDKKEARTCEPARIPFLLNQVDDRPLRTRSSIEKAFGGRS